MRCPVTLRDAQGDLLAGIYHPTSVTGGEPLISVNGTTWDEAGWARAGWAVYAWGSWEE